MALKKRKPGGENMFSRTKGKNGKKSVFVRAAVASGIVLCICAVAGGLYMLKTLNGVVSSQYILRKMADPNSPSAEVRKFGEGRVGIIPGKQVRAGSIRSIFGIKEGVNLNEIDFEAKRRALLAKYPVVKSVKIVRHLPLDIDIELEEREPVARLVPGGGNRRVVDETGVVFDLPPERTANLPVIENRGAKDTILPGKSISGHAMSALRVINELKTGRYPNVIVVEVKIADPECLQLMLNNYRTHVKLAWEAMDEISPESDHEMRKQLSRLNKAISLGGEMRNWDLTTDRPTGAY